MRSVFSNPRLFLLLAVIASVCPASAQHTHHAKKLVREQIEDLEHQWQQAATTADIATIDKMLSDDYLGITVNGDLLTKTQELDRVRAHATTIQKLDFAETKIKVVGPVAIVNSLATIQGNSGGRPISGSFRYTRVYQRVGFDKIKSKGKRGESAGQWKITSFEVTRIPHTGSGDQMPPSVSEPSAK